MKLFIQNTLVIATALGIAVGILVGSMHATTAAMAVGQSLGYERPVGILTSEDDLVREYAREITGDLSIEVRWDADTLCEDALGCVTSVDHRVIHLAPRWVEYRQEHPEAARAAVIHEAAHVADYERGIDTSPFDDIDEDVPGVEAFADCVAQAVAEIAFYLPKGCPDDLRARALDLIGG